MIGIQKSYCASETRGKIEGEVGASSMTLMVLIWSRSLKHGCL